MTAKVEVRCRHWVRTAWGQIVREVDCRIYLNGTHLRTFSTHGDMAEGYWGREAENKARRYANSVARVLGTVVVWTHANAISETCTVPVKRSNPCQAT